jgi:hypothetical protein
MKKNLSQNQNNKVKGGRDIEKIKRQLLKNISKLRKNKW